MNTFPLFWFVNYFTFNLAILWKNALNDFLKQIFFISKYYRLVDLIWQEGLLIDFLQKKIIDNWMKKFLIYSSYLFNERLVFDKITRFYLDLIIWPMHKLFVFEFASVSNILFINVYFFIFSFFIFSFFFFFSLMF